MNTVKMSLATIQGKLSRAEMKIGRILLLFLLFSCHSVSKYGVPNEDPVKILKSSMSFWTYYSQQIRLFEDFVALTPDDSIINKGQFLEQLETGNFIPLRLTSKETVCYKLYKINPTIVPDIAAMIRTEATLAYKDYKMEGKPLPAFSFQDINHVPYSSDRLKGEILVLKFWFLHCSRCVQEIPELNALIQKYKERKDILFNNITFDSTQDLRHFLSKTPISGVIIPNQQDYVCKQMGITLCPTYVIVNKQGIIDNVVNSIQAVKRVLNRDIL